MEETKFLGAIFDRRLSLVSHLKYVTKKDVTECGVDRKIMLSPYRSPVRSKLDYGCIVTPSVIDLIDLVHIHNNYSECPL